MCLVTVALLAGQSLGCSSSNSKPTGTGGSAAGSGGMGQGGGNAGTGGAGGGSTPLTRCVDKVGADYHVATIMNMPDGICDTRGSFTLMVQGTAALTNGTLFRSDSTGTNLNTSGGHFNSGVWTTQSGAQNVPGNYVAHLFVTTVPDPGPGDFLALSAPLSANLSAGANIFYWFADSDDTTGGSFGFGLNLWLGGAAADAPSISAFTATVGGALAANGTAGCAPAFDGTCATSASTLSWTSGTSTATLTSFSIDGIGGDAVHDAGTSD
jgi:hypothetical protein